MIKLNPTFVTLAAVIFLGALVFVSWTRFETCSLFGPTAPSLDLEEVKESMVRNRLDEAESQWLQGKAKKQKANLAYTALEANPWNHIELRSFWDFFYPNFDCPHLTQRVGRLGDGGKWVCGLNRLKKKKKPCIVYSYGIASEMSFEEEILQQTNCSVYMYDHTIQAKNVYLLKQYPGRAIFYQLGIGQKNTDQLRTLKSEMDKHRHGFIDILKMDIEGAEYKSLEQVNSDFPQGFPFGQLLIELHTTAFPESGLLKQMSKWYEMLENGGLRAFKNEPNLICLLLCFEHSFINTAVDNFLLHAYEDDDVN